MVTRLSLALLALAAAGLVIVDALNLQWDPVETPASQYIHGRAGWLTAASLTAIAVASALVTVALRAPRTVRWLLGTWSILVLVAAAAPANAPGTWDQPLAGTATVHGLAGVVAFLVLLVAVLAFAGSPRATRPARIAAGLLVAAQLCYWVTFVDVLDGPSLSLPGHASVVGLTERVLLLAALGWLATAAWALRRPPARGSSTGRDEAHARHRDSGIREDDPMNLGLAMRRRWPVGVLLVCVAAVISLRTAGLTHAAWVAPVTVAFALVVLYGHLAWAVGTGVAVLAFGGAWEWSVVGRPFADVITAVGIEALWLATVLAGTEAYRNRRRWQREVLVGRLAEQRLQIAREVHDVVAHTLTVVGVQLRVADEALDDAPEQSRAAIATAQAVRRGAMEDLRGLVGVLRAAESPEPAAGLDDLRRLVTAVSSDALVAELVCTGRPRSVPAPVGLALTRVVQESLTNVVRHAHARTVRVELHYGHSEVEIVVTDDGAGSAAGHGHGLLGLRERVSALGGSFAAGPAPSGGFTVRASIPVPAP